MDCENCGRKREDCPCGKAFTSIQLTIKLTPNPFIREFWSKGEAASYYASKAGINNVAFTPEEFLKRIKELHKEPPKQGRIIVLDESDVPEEF